MAELMKGETFKDALKPVRGKPRFEYPLYVEVKADEIRCQVMVKDSGVEFLSYAGKPLHNLESFAAQFLALAVYTGRKEFDLGIRVSGNFNDSYRWVRSSNGHPKEKLDKKTGKVAPALDPSMVEFILFDMPESDQPYRYRLDERSAIAYDASNGLGLRMSVPLGEVAFCEDDVWRLYRQYREDLGEEGAMAKTLDHLYERKRSFNWMKVKPSDDIDGKIERLNEARSEAGEPLGRVGSVDVMMPDGSVASPAGFPHELGRLMWENPEQYIGQWLTFNYMERDRQGGYRHPTFERFREDK